MFTTLQGCKSRGIKLCGALAAAGLIAARSSKQIPDHQTERYAVVTLTDCRSILDPLLPNDQLGKPLVLYKCFSVFDVYIQLHQIMTWNMNN